MYPSQCGRSGHLQAGRLAIQEGDGWEVLADPSVKQLLCHPPIRRFPKVGTLYSSLQWIVPKSFSRIDVHWWDDSASSTDATQGGYLLLVVPRYMVDIVSPLWSKNLATLGTKWKTTLITVPNLIRLVEQIMLDEELLKLKEPFVKHISCAGTSTRSLKSLWLPHCNLWVSTYIETHTTSPSQVGCQ